MAGNRQRQTASTVIELPFDDDGPPGRIYLCGPLPEFLREEAESTFQHFLDHFLIDAFIGKPRRACAYQVARGILIKLRFPEWWGRTLRQGRLPTPRVHVIYSETNSPHLPSNTQVLINDQRVDNYFNDRLRTLILQFRELN